MTATTLLADNGVTSGVTGYQLNGGNDGTLQLQTTTAGGAATTAVTISNAQAVTFAQPANLPNTFGFKNRLINGACVIDQRYAGAATANTISNYVIDRWSVQQTTTGKLVAQQNSGSVTPPAGFTNYFGVVSQSAYSVSSGDQFLIQQPIEGYSVSDFAYGTASAATSTVSFWARSSLTGTFSAYILLYNGSSFQSYAFTYSLPTANTWTYVTATIPGNTSFVGSQTNGIGMWLRINLGSGSNFNETAGSWQAGNTGFVSGSQSVVGTSGATFYITGVQLEKGTTATSFDYRPYGTELALCQRYYEQINPGQAIAGSASGTVAFLAGSFAVQKRTAPSLANAGSGINVRIYGAGPSSTTYSGSGVGSVNYSNTNGYELQVGGFTSLGSGAGSFYSASSAYSFSAEL